MLGATWIVHNSGSALAHQNLRSWRLRFDLKGKGSIWQLKLLASVLVHSKRRWATTRFDST